jgi:SPP1 family predicted phage head-tail adaptor
MLKAGALRDRVTFQKRTATDDGYGNPISGDFTNQFTVWADIQYRAGGEAVQSERLAGTQPVTIVVRSSSQTRLVTTAWRAVNARSGEIYNLQTAANMDGRGEAIEFMATSGEAT